MGRTGTTLTRYSADHASEAPTTRIAKLNCLDITTYVTTSGN